MGESARARQNFGSALHIPDGKYIIVKIAIFIGIAINLIGRFGPRMRPT